MQDKSRELFGLDSLPRCRLAQLEIRELQTSVNEGAILEGPFQRDGTWTDIMQSEFIASIFQGYTHMSPIVFNVSLQGSPQTRTPIDGQQRVLAILRFLDGAIGFQNFYFHSNEASNTAKKQLPELVRDAFLKTTITIAEYQNLSLEQQREVFTRSNNTLSLTSSEKWALAATATADLVRDIRDQYLEPEDFGGPSRSFLRFLPSESASAEFKLFAVLVRAIHLLSTTGRYDPVTSEDVSRWISSDLAEEDFRTLVAFTKRTLDRLMTITLDYTVATPVGSQYASTHKAFTRPATWNQMELFMLPYIVHKHYHLTDGRLRELCEVFRSRVAERHPGIIAKTSDSWLSLKYIADTLNISSLTDKYVQREEQLSRKRSRLLSSTALKRQRLSTASVATAPLHTPSVKPEPLSPQNTRNALASSSSAASTSADPVASTSALPKPALEIRRPAITGFSIKGAGHTQTSSLPRKENESSLEAALRAMLPPGAPPEYQSMDASFATSAPQERADARALRQHSDQMSMRNAPAELGFSQFSNSAYSHQSPFSSRPNNRESSPPRADSEPKGPRTPAEPEPHRPTQQQLSSPPTAPASWLSRRISAPEQLPPSRSVLATYLTRGFYEITPPLWPKECCFFDTVDKCNNRAKRQKCTREHGARSGREYVEQFGLPRKVGRSDWEFLRNGRLFAKAIDGEIVRVGD